MNTSALLMGLLVSGFFAIACFRARATDMSELAVRPGDFFRLTDRIERLRRSRWQWCAMVAVLILVRQQSGLPIVIEWTAALQFVLFLSLPTYKGKTTPPKSAGSFEWKPWRLWSKRKPSVGRNEPVAHQIGS